LAGDVGFQVGCTTRRQCFVVVVNFGLGIVLTLTLGLGFVLKVLFFCLFWNFVEILLGCLSLLSCLPILLTELGADKNDEDGQNDEQKDQNNGGSSSYSVRVLFLF